MLNPNFTLLYVKNPTASAAFYADLLGKAPIEASPTFALFALDGGARLGLWAAATVEPAATPAGGSEMAFSVDSDEAVARVHEAWITKGIDVLQAPTDMDFGRNFLARDPDGHRLRVFTPRAE